ncbi:MAG: hypothetical protein A2289_16850 [Deltaproteobacteria bacterium RIFOXYA12_FULL_58_15]|nr:MAG: hypothetical protein A2289_16850 [Deltaproteobacteria bacterium RIFOXYA12_FULL_58_15]OGR10299.1 MAG: hypothetical protein A2341_16880 [Deltaproteobacteria bacterium RIFOXYB12_FULL_58_9]
MLLALAIGFAFGFVGSMPVAGPIAVLVFARGLENRFVSGIWIAVGGAVAEGIYAGLAFWGFTELLARFPILLPICRITAAVVLTILGIVFVRRRSLHESKEVTPPSDRWTGSFALGFTITALNPTLIATWSAAATTLVATGTLALDRTTAVPFGLAAAVGIVAWFCVLLFLVHQFRGRFSIQTLDKIVRAMGILLLVIAAWFVFLFIQSVTGQAVGT